MPYLIASVLLFSINNVLWARYAKVEQVFILIKNRALFTTLGIGGVLALGVLGFQEQITTVQILPLGLISLVGFAGLLCLVYGFKYGNVLQFAIYSLLLTLALGLWSTNAGWAVFQNKSLALGCIAIGYALFSFSQFDRRQKQTQTLKAHLCFLGAHLAFGFLVVLQFRYLKVVSAVYMAFVQELVVLAGCAILVNNPRGKPTRH